MRTLDPIAPGGILLKEFMEPLGISQNKLARDIDVPVTRIGDIVHARRGITADSALRLAIYFVSVAEEFAVACRVGRAKRAPPFFGRIILVGLADQRCASVPVDSPYCFRNRNYFDDLAGDRFFFSGLLAALGQPSLA